MSDAGNDAGPGLTETEQKAANQKKARRRHRKRFRDQILLWGFSMFFAAISYPIQYAFTTEYAKTCVKIPQRLQASCIFEPYAALISILLVFFLVSLIWNYFYHENISKDWRQATSDAKGLTSAQDTAQGYTGLFRIYVQTKRRSYHLISWGLLAFTYFVTGVVADFKIGLGNDIVRAPILWVPLAIEFVIGLMLFRLAYGLGRSYLPGDVIVRYTLKLAYYALFKPQDQQEADRQIETQAKQFEKDSPWWFYSG